MNFEDFKAFLPSYLGGQAEVQQKQIYSSFLKFRSDEPNPKEALIQFILRLREAEEDLEKIDRLKWDFCCRIVEVRRLPFLEKSNETGGLKLNPNLQCLQIENWPERRGAWAIFINGKQTLTQIKLTALEMELIEGLQEGLVVRAESTPEVLNLIKHQIIYA